MRTSFHSVKAGPFFYGPEFIKTSLLFTMWFNLRPEKRAFFKAAYLINTRNTAIKLI